MQRSARELYEQASRGDAPALGELLEHHLPGLLAFVRARAGRKLLAREASIDLVQSACREVLADLSQHAYQDEAHLRRWLYLAAERKILDRARYLQREKRVGVEREQGLSAVEADLVRRGFSSFVSPSRDAAGREELARAEQALAGLSDEHREVILLARVLGLSHAEIADELGKSEVATRSLLSRALAELAVRMGRIG